MLYTGDKLSSPIFCCLSVCEVLVTPDQISTFSNIYRHTSPLLTMYHLIPSSTNLYWPSTSQYRHILTQYHQVPLIIHHLVWHSSANSMIFLFTTYLMSHAQYTSSCFDLWTIIFISSNTWFVWCDLLRHLRLQPAPWASSATSWWQRKRHFYNYDIFIDLAQTKWQSLTTRGKTLKSCSLCLSRATTSWLPQRQRRLNYEKLKWSSGLPWIFSSTQNYSSKRALSFVTIVKWISFWLKLNKNTLDFTVSFVPH